MRGKRGLSQVVTTMILVVLILAAVAGLWIAVSGFIQSGTDQLNLDRFTLGLSLKKVVVDYDTGLAEVRVRRDSGEGDLRSIKFIVEDDFSSEIYEEFFDSFPELAERTFVLNLSESEFLTLNKVHKISIAPVFGSGAGVGSSSGGLTTGEISGSIEGLNSALLANATEEVPEEAQCILDSECPADSYLANTEGCNPGNTMVTQTKLDSFCQFEFCRTSPIYEFPIEDCGAQGKVCYDGECIDEEIGCTPETVAICGTDGPEGGLICHPTLNATAQKMNYFTCNAQNVCQLDSSDEVVEMCEVGDICNNGECFTPLECETHEDCCTEENPYCGRICSEGECEDELVLNTGIVSSAWPPGIGEYFDSSDLNAFLPDENVVGNTIIFPGSLQDRCLYINTFVHVDINGVISYVQLSETITNISSGDYYEIWETPFGCTKI